MRRPAGEASPTTPGSVATAAFVGTVLEWYDYFLYGTAAALVFNRLYFGTGSAVAGTLAGFATFAVGFAARPLGAVIFGHIGDRFGRRGALMITITGIGIVTGAIGLLPAYAHIGVMAPILLTLLRLLQGVAMGGEWSGAIVLAVEHAPTGRRGRYASLPQLGSPVATLLSAGAFAAVSLLPDESFDAWGWRLPFLAALPMLLIALRIRRKLEESPAFLELLEDDEAPAAPVRDVFRSSLRGVFAGMLAALLPVGGWYLLTVFGTAYGTHELGLSKSLMLGATLIGAALMIPVIIASGRAAERFGAGQVCAVGAAATLVAAFPSFWLLDTGEPVLVIVGIAIGIGCQTVPFAVVGLVLSELFPVPLRYTGVAVSYTAGGIVGGLMPLIATALTTASGGSPWPAAGLLAALSVLNGVGALASVRLRDRSVELSARIVVPDASSA